jgi:alpha-1,2-mannosyltransferase
MVNSSWTLNHINSLWSLQQRTTVVYPPCDVEKFILLSSQERDNNFYVASLAQFRPEKNHQLQLKSFAEFLQRYVLWWLPGLLA